MFDRLVLLSAEPFPRMNAQHPSFGLTSRHVYVYSGVSTKSFAVGLGRTVLGRRRVARMHRKPAGTGYACRPEENYLDGLEPNT